MKAFIVDDNTERANSLLKSLAARPHEEGMVAEWLRPKPFVARLTVGVETIIPSADELISRVKSEAENPAIWFWDVKLIFPERILLGSDYHSGGDMFDLLRQLLNNGSVIVLSSGSEATSIIKKALVAASCPQDHILEEEANFETFVTDEAKRKFCDELVEKGVHAFKGSILAVLAGFPNDHYVTDSPPYAFLPHNWKSEVATQNRSRLTDDLVDILRKLSTAPRRIVEEIVSKSPEGVFETTKTLIGHHAKIHSGDGYSPCLGILPFLLLRALMLSGKWNEVELKTLFQKVTWVPAVRYLPLCSNKQKAESIRDWLKQIGDTLLPILALNHDKTDRSRLESIELNEPGRFFRLRFESEWSTLFSKVEADDVAGGSTYRAWRNSNRLLAICPENGGWDSSCSVNVYSLNGKTIWDFRVNRSQK